MAANDQLTPRQRLAQLVIPRPRPPATIGAAPQPGTPESGATSAPSEAQAGTRPLLVMNPDNAPAPSVNVHEAIRKRVGVPDATVRPTAEPAKPASARDRLRSAAAAVGPLEDVPYEHDIGGASGVFDDVELSPAPKASAPVVGNGATPAVAVVPGKAMSMRDRLRAAATSQAPGLDQGEYQNRPDGVVSTREVDHEEVIGTLNSLKEFNGWAVGSLWTEDRKEIRVTGEGLVGLTEGLEYVFKGRLTDHAQYGPGFDVVSVRAAISPNDQAIERFLVRSFKGIGEAKATKYVKSVRASGGDEAVEKLRETLLNSPWDLDLTKIAKGAKFSEAEDPQGAMKQLMVTRNLMLNLGNKGGLREATAKLLAGHLMGEIKQKKEGDEDQQAVLGGLGAADVVSATWTILMLNPYGPIHKVPGYGFATAEAIAAVAGVPKDSPLRLGALVEYAVEEGCKRRGHTFLRTAEFVEAIRRVDPSAPAQQALVHAIEQFLVVIDAKRVYPSRLLEAEKDVAVRLAKLMQPAEPLTKRTAAEVNRKLDRDPEKINIAFKDGFDADQKSAISGIMTSNQRLHVLTGGPGTGKTAIMEVLLTLLKHKRFVFCGPTGKSAKVLTARVSGYGYSASTVNSVLKGAEESGFEVNEEDPLDCDVLVVDENTMNGIGMASGILAAMQPDTHLIVLGDPGLPANPNVPGSGRAGQLPSISPGRFMQDLLLLPGVQHVHLTKTYRNSGGILEVVSEIARGDIDTTDRASVKFSHGLPDPAEGFPEVMSEYLGRIAKDGFENTFLVMPIRKGDRETPGWNTTYANHVLRQTCNPYGQKIPGTSLFLGDRIMVRENMTIAQPKASELGNVVLSPTAAQTSGAPFDFARLAKKPAEVSNDPAAFFEPDEEDDDDVIRKRVVNGDTGTIVAYAMGGAAKQLGSPRWIRLALDDGQVVEFPGADAGSLDHAYAGTVHSAQGSEYKNVIMVVTPGSPDFMHQNMLFTGLSRPRGQLSVWGDDRVIKKIAATPMPPRNSGLVERVKQCLAEMDSPQPAGEEEAYTEGGP